MRVGLHNASYKAHGQSTICQSGKLSRKSRRPALVETVLSDRSVLSPIPEGVALGFQVSARVPCEHWIYCMETPDGLIKVGSSHQPARRYRSLLHVSFARNGLACRAIWSIGVMTRRAAVDFEFGVHKVLRAQFEVDRWQEWYRATAVEAIPVIERHIVWSDDSALVGLS